MIKSEDVFNMKRLQLRKRSLKYFVINTRVAEDKIKFHPTFEMDL